LDIGLEQIFENQALDSAKGKAALGLIRAQSWGRERSLSREGLSAKTESAVGRPRKRAEESPVAAKRN